MLRFDKNLSAIHAYLCADGYVIKNPVSQKKKYYMIGFRNTNSVLIKDFQKKFFHYFGLKPYVTNDGRCRISNKLIYHKLTKNFSYYSKNWELPKLTKSCLRLWLRAYFDSDGWVMVRKGRDRHIGLDSINLEGLTQIRKSLKILGIESRIKHNNYRSIHRLYIYGNVNLLRYKKLIGFLHPKKAELLQEAIESYIDYKWKTPHGEKEMNFFFMNILKQKITNDTKRVKVCSKYKKNLGIMKEWLRTNLSIHSILSKERFNGNNISYYELSINKKQDIKSISKLFKNTKLATNFCRY